MLGPATQAEFEAVAKPSEVRQGLLFAVLFVQVERYVSGDVY